MIYTVEFKEKCFRVLRFTPYLLDIMKALEVGNTAKLRYCLEDSLDDDELFDNEVTNDDGDRIIKDAKIHAFNERTELYTEFMEQLIKELDNVPIYA